MLNEPFMTYNFFSTPILITVLGYFVKKWIDDTQQAAHERDEVVSRKLASIDACLTAIKVGMENKVERKECEEKSAEKWERIYHHRHTESGDVVVL